MLKKIIIIFVFSFLIYSGGNAQVTAAKVGVDGFTCSLCAKGVEGQLKALDFVQSVSTDLKNSTFTLKFNNKRIDLNKIQKAVSDAGFTLRDVEVDAKGKIEEINGVYKLNTGNSPGITLSNIETGFNVDDMVSVKGVFSVKDNSVKLKSISKTE
jgi:copper chaperone CopZ